MLSVKQGSIKYHFLSLSYDSTWDWTQVPRLLANTLLIKPMAQLLPYWELSTLAKELMAATHVIQSSSDKLNTPVSDSAKCKEMKANTKMC